MCRSTPWCTVPSSHSHGVSDEANARACMLSVGLDIRARPSLLPYRRGSAAKMYNFVLIFSILLKYQLELIGFLPAH